MERENGRGRIALTVIGAATLLIALAGATFAYFSATSTTTTQTITTSSLNLTVAADGEATHVSGIKPTTWVSNTDAKTNNDIAIIPFKVTGSSSTDGTYTVNLSTNIVLNSGTVVEEQGQAGVPLTGGDVSDIKYRLFTKEGTELGSEKSFSATTNEDIVTNGTITADVPLNDEYILYVYIENDESNPQNKLQGIDFTITLGGSASQA